MVINNEVDLYVLIWEDLKGTLHRKGEEQCVKLASLFNLNI